MSKWSIFALIVVMCLALVLRFWQLGSVPVGPNWDEAAIGYNGWSIWHTRRDEWLERLPISFRSFGDYKAPLAIYLNGLFTTFLGLEIRSIRLPFAVSGVLAVVGFTLLLTQMLRLVPKKTLFLSSNAVLLLGTMLFATSPWHILFSRVGFESGIALTQVLWATSLLFISTNYSRNTWKRNGLQLVSVLLFASTFYTYHSAKVMVPLFLVLLFVFMKSLKLISRKKIFLLSGGIVFMIIPFIFDSIFGEGLTRASVTIFAQSRSISEILVLLWQNTLAHIGPGFLLFGKTDSIRHSIGTMGVFYPTTLLCILLGLVRGIAAYLSKIHKQNGIRMVWLFAICWIVVGLAPAIIGVEVPHPNRALLSLPGFLLLALVGVDLLAKLIHQHLKLTGFFSNIVIILFVLFEVAQASLFLNRYFDSYAKESSASFQDGYDEVFTEVWSYYDGTNAHVPIDQFVITSEYGQPYIYALISRKITTYEYHNGALINFLFPDIVQLSDLDRPNALVVAGEKSDVIDRTKANKVIYSKDGKPKFWIFDTNTL